MGSKKNVDMSSTEDKIKIVESVAETPAATETEAEGTEAAAKKVTKVVKARSKKYQAARSQIDKTKKYDLFAAIEMVKRLSYSRFDGTIEAHAVLKEAGVNEMVSFPHKVGKPVRVAIADDELLKQIKDGVIEFDVLVSTKEFMPKLTKFARVLGPRGLMPNPKSGTLTEHPEVKKEQLEGGSLNIKSEKKAPLIHTTVGKVSMDTKDLVENVQALLKAFKGRVLRLSISATMSPSVKVMVE